MSPLTDESYGDQSVALHTEAEIAKSTAIPEESCVVDRFSEFELRFRSATRIPDRATAQAVRNRSSLRIIDTVKAQVSLQAAHVLQVLVDMVFPDQVRRHDRRVLLRVVVSRGMIAKRCRWCSHTEEEAKGSTDDAVRKSTQAGVKRVARALKCLEQAGYLSRDQRRSTGCSETLIELPMAKEWVSHFYPESTPQAQAIASVHEPAPASPKSSHASGIEASRAGDSNVPTAGQKCPTSPTPHSDSTHSSTNTKTRERAQVRDAGSLAAGAGAGAISDRSEEPENIRILRRRRREAFETIETSNGPRIGGTVLRDVGFRRLKPSTIIAQAKRIASDRAIRNPIGTLVAVLKNLPDDMSEADEAAWRFPLKKWGDIVDLLTETSLPIDLRVVGNALILATKDTGCSSDRPACSLVEIYNATHRDRPAILWNRVENQYRQVIGYGLKNASPEFFAWIVETLENMRRDAMHLSRLTQEIESKSVAFDEVKRIEQSLKHGRIESRTGSGGFYWVEVTHETKEHAIADGFVAVVDAWNEARKEIA